MSLMSRINENTSIPLKIVVAIVGATIAISLQLASLRSELAQINRKLDSGWSIENMTLWTTKFQRDNPQLKIPNATEGFPARP
jgi:hypothetical protein